MKTFDEYKKEFAQMSKGEQVALWNEYKDFINDYNNEVYSMEDLDEIMYGKTPSEILRMAFFGYDQNTERERYAREHNTHNNRGEFNPNRDWFTFNGYGNLVSLEDVEVFGFIENDNFVGYLDVDEVLEIYEWLKEYDRLE